MSSNDDYRSRARDVRASARAKLAEIRAARASRAGRAVSAATPDPALTAKPDGAPSFTASVRATALAAESAGEAPQQQSAAPQPPEPAPAGEASSAVADAAGRELARLPGIGPGLIWILERSGVETLADLAACDAEELRARVGFLGSLVNVDAWIAFARQDLEARAA